MPKSNHYRELVGQLMEIAGKLKRDSAEPDGPPGPAYRLEVAAKTLQSMPCQHDPESQPTEGRSTCRWCGLGLVRAWVPDPSIIHRGQVHADQAIGAPACSCPDKGRDPHCPAHGFTASEVMSRIGVEPR